MASWDQPRWESTFKLIQSNLYPSMAKATTNPWHPWVGNTSSLFQCLSILWGKNCSQSPSNPPPRPFPLIPSLGSIPAPSWLHPPVGNNEVPSAQHKGTNPALVLLQARMLLESLAPSSSPDPFP